MKLKGKVLISFPDGKESVLGSEPRNSQQQKELFASIPGIFKPRARIRVGKYGQWHVEVKVPLETDVKGKAFRRLTEVWVEHIKRRLRAARGGSRKREGR